MRIAVDARALLSERTGIGIYTENILRGLAREDDLEPVALTPRLVEPPLAGAGGVEFRSDRSKFGIIWVQTLLARRAREAACDVLLAALTAGPVRCPIPVVPVVHDLTPLTHPEWHRRKTIAGLLPWLETTLDRAARIIAVSHATARVLLERFPETRGRISVVDNGVEERFSPGGDGGKREETRRLFTRGRPFVLHLGTLEPRKNLLRLVVACESLWRQKRSRPDLLLAGGAGWKSGPLLERIARSPFRDKIHRAGYVNRREAVDLYRACDLFCYPSLAEGFGLPVVEAMACGAPTVISDAEALVEVAGDGALAAPAEDAEALAARLAQVLDDPDLSKSLSSKGIARARHFSWERASRETAAVLRSAGQAA